jgi:hypothetical protein
MFKQVPWQLLDIGLDLRLVQKELERIAGRFDRVAAQAAAALTTLTAHLHSMQVRKNQKQQQDEVLMAMLGRLTQNRSESGARGSQKVYEGDPCLSCRRRSYSPRSLPGSP